MIMPGQENEPWGCGYHGDDGYSFYSGSGGPYGESYATGDIIRYYLNFRNKILFYTKNGINLVKGPNNAFKLRYQGKLYFIMSKYDKTFEDLTRLLKIEPDNTIALKYRDEINYIIKKYNELIANFKELLKIKPNDKWAKKVYELVKRLKYDMQL
ncbi:hypothetical protein C2G38_2045265 [Gigaspora rosea]|uniref:SPRY domain-containing protein n=1 Tax=Gigaspora rosea TaxID=44941 RepID=A0A397UDR4_9GLOM|nr:hypothetical protein C2G38_2045265 [Gigaspora rosea]